MKNRFIWSGYVLFAIGFVLLLNFSVRAYSIRLWNLGAEDDFQQKEESPYAKKIPMEEMVRPMSNDQPAIMKYLSTRKSWEEERSKDDRTFVLRCTLHYYASPDDAEPVYSIPAGTVVAYEGAGDSAAAYNTARLYGITSLPTYEAGWRYTRPFLAETEGNTVTTESIRALPWYYVESDAIENAFYDAMEQNGLWEERLDRVGHNQDFVARQRFTVIWSAITGIDRELRDRGIYLSPDLAYPALDRVNVWLLTAVGVCAITGAGLLLWEKKRQKKR